jgi:hypothetical protein
MKASDYVASAARHVIVYGGPKTGKTELVGTLAEKYRLHWFSLDGGIKTLFRPDSAARKHLDNIELYNIPDSQIFPVAVETMLKVLKSGKHNICHKHGKVSCPACKEPGMFSTYSPDELTVDKDVVVIDHYSQLMDSVVNYIHKDALSKDNWDGIKSNYDDWAKQGAMSDRFGSVIQNAPYNVVVISHEVLTELEDGTKKIAPVGGTRNKSSDFARYFDDVVYTEIVGGEYKAQVAAVDKTRTIIGTRSGKSLKAEKGKQVSLLDLFK